MNNTLENMNDSSLILDEFYPKIYPVIALYFPVFISALVSNILVIAVVIKFHYMRNVTNYFLVNLSVSDLLVTLICMPNAAMEAYVSFWYLGEYACIAWKYLQCISVASSVFTITTMALDRYLAITRPFGVSRRFCINHKSALVIIAILWVTSMIIFLPLLFVTEVFSVDYVPGKFCGEVRWDRIDAIYPSYIFAIVCFSVMFVIPGGIMLWAYAMMGKKLCSVRPPSDNNEGSISTQQSYRIMRERKRVALILLLLAFMFAVCWLPQNLYLLYIEITGYQGPNKKQISQYLLLLGHANSALNPIIYCLMSKNFRKSVKNLVFETCFNFQSRQNHQLRWYDTSRSSQRLYCPNIYVHTYNKQHNTLSRVQSSLKTTKTCAV